MALLSVDSFDCSGNSASWLKRVFENVRQLFPASGIGPTSANGAPLHFESIDLSARHGKAQTYSAVVHAAILLTLAFALVSPPVRHNGPNSISLGLAHDPLAYVPPAIATSQAPSLGSMGGGGENDPRPSRSGNLAPASTMPLAPPRLKHNEDATIPAPPAVFDPDAPASVATAKNLGIPWMNGDADSAGPGKGHGFGTGNGGAMGDGNGSGAGAGDSNAPYSNVLSPVACLYCPDPPYTEEARKAKLQGKVLLRVLVGPDGTAQRIEVLKGLGMGLEERAEETIHSWKFAPARDGAKRPVATWINIETRFQLF
jgi:periplasmic protein TonB